jgi:hypothetical protein
MAEEVRVVTPGFFQGVGQDGQAVERSVLVDQLGQPGVSCGDLVGLVRGAW